MKFIFQSLTGLAAIIILNADGMASAQEVSTNSVPESSPTTTLKRDDSANRLGPFDIHGQISTGIMYDDNILFSTNKLADEIWTIQPGFQISAGDTGVVNAAREQNNGVANFSPDTIIIQRPEDWPEKIFLLDYSPRFQIFDKYTSNDAIDEFAALTLLLPFNKLVLGFRQDYDLQTMTVVEAGQRTTVENINSTLTAAYQFNEKTSIESDVKRLSVGYDQPGLTGYTEYNTENWLNYEVRENLPISAGVLAGFDEVQNNQDQEFEQLRIRARYKFSEKLSFDASAGVELREYENGSHDSFFPVFNAAGQYQPTDRLLLTVDAYRQQYASILNDYNYTKTGALLYARQGITDRFAASVSLGYYSLEFMPIQGGLAKYTEDYYTARVSLDVKILRHFSGLIFYQLLKTSSPTGDVTDNQVGAQLTLSY